MPILERPVSIAPPALDTDEGLIYLESQRSWKHRLRQMAKASSEFLRRERLGFIPKERTKDYFLSDTVKLEADFSKLARPFVEALAVRETLQAPAARCRPVGLSELATLLIGSFGEQRALPGGERAAAGHRTVPSPGALFTTELYYLSLRTDGLAPGLYHFRPDKGVLETLPLDGTPAAWIERTFVRKRAVEMRDQMSGVIFMTSVFHRMRLKYGRRYLRFCLIEIGCVCQNLSLVSAALGLQIWHQSSPEEGATRALLRIDGLRETVLHSAIISAPATDV